MTKGQKAMALAMIYPEPHSARNVQKLNNFSKTRLSQARTVLKLATKYDARDESQRGMIASRLANQKVGKPKANSLNLDDKPITLASAAEKMNVSRAAVAKAKTVQSEGAKRAGQSTSKLLILESLIVPRLEQFPCPYSRRRQSHENFRCLFGTHAIAAAEVVRLFSGIVPA